MSDDLELEERLYRTWIQYLIDNKRRELAGLVVDGELRLVEPYDYTDSYFYYVKAVVYLPHASHRFILDNKDIDKEIRDSLWFILKGNIQWFEDEFYIELVTKLMDIEPDWRKTIKYLIANSKDLNQGLITEKAFAKKDKEPIVYNEIKFASNAEIRIAQELESQKVLFFPLPLAVRRETGDNYKDHREVDFLICLNGTWGILEVSYHPDRYERDAEKDAWFKKSGILCIEHRSAERCYNQPKTVVAEFLNILSKHRR
jgi:hypothetical protein